MIPACYHWVLTFANFASPILQTIVSVSHLAAYHSERNFTDAEQFVPERHLDDPRYVNDRRSVMQPFSFGPRNCIGRK
jgi:cytochrome P450